MDITALTESINAGILLANVDGTINAVNKRFSDLVGYSKEEIIGKKIYDIFFPENSTESKRYASLMAARYSMRKDGQSEIYRTRIFAKNGDRKWVETRAAPLVNANGKIIGSVGLNYEVVQGFEGSTFDDDSVLFSDFSDRVERLKDGENLESFFTKHTPGFASIVNGLNDAVVIADNGFLWFANPRFYEITGFTEEEVFMKRVHEIYFPSGSPESIAEEKRIRSFYEKRLSGVSETYETHIIRKNGERRWIETKASPIKDSHGNIISSVGIISDITERKHLEEQLRWSQKMEAVGRLAGGIAHDFNNLLTVIQGYASDIQNQLQTNPELFKKAGVIVEAGEAAGALTQQLLSISRKQVIQMAPVSLNDVVERSIRVIQGLMGERIETEVNLAHQLPLTVADASQLQQILINLAVNSRDAMPEGGTLKIFTDLVNKAGNPIATVNKKAENFVRLRIVDTGHGISDEIKTKIFEPFFTTKRAKGRGSGLGLSITFGIVREHKGELRVESKPGEGATFDILLPVDVEKQEAGAAQRHDWKPLTGSEVVLLAEDQMGVRSLIKDTLERFGYKVYDAGDGAEALEIAAKLERIDLLVTDLVMPRVGGLQLATELSKQRPGVGLIVISGYPDERDVWKILSDLGCEFMAKPFSPEMLARLVRKVLDKKLAVVAQ
jgi:two-component system cell cycle sensor histidine kinase/response regulator CckA